MCFISSFSIAQDDTKYEFSGKVGGLSVLDQDYESTVMIELNIAYSITKHIAISGGAIFCNFRGPSEVLVGGEDFREYLETFAPLRIEPVQMDAQIFMAKLVFKTGGKKVSPYLAAGIGGYQFYYKQNVFGTSPIVIDDEPDEVPMPIYFKETSFGVNVGGGIDFFMNDFLSIKFEGCYHKIFYELIEQQIAFSAGFGFNF